MSTTHDDGADGGHDDVPMEDELDDDASGHETSPSNTDEDSDGEEQAKNGDDDGTTICASIFYDASEGTDSPDSDTGEGKWRKKYLQLKTRHQQDLDDQRRDAEERLNEKNIEIEQQQKRHEALQRTIHNREEQIKRLRERLLGVKQDQPVSWRVQLRAHLQDGSHEYSEIYRDCCKQENMSSKLNVFHPDFRLTDKEVPPRGDPEVLPSDPTTYRRPDQYVSDWQSFPFDRLPADIKARIFKKVFVRRDLIHCLSRLDPFSPPDDFPNADQQGRSQLPNRFHFGPKPCRIASARKPNDVLAPLLVCKSWYFIGVHAFYGANTFAFSSLGEWHRFCNGIGVARVERLANVELLWHGGLMPTNLTRISSRTLGLSWFTRTSRLRTLVVHISETAKGRRRRRYEEKKRKKCRQRSRQRGDDAEEGQDDEAFLDGSKSHLRNPFKFMVQRTATQPNQRAFRSMRTVQGMDYIYQLRGMNWVRFSDCAGSEHRQAIQDWTFLKDINNVVTLPKDPELATKSDLYNLTPLTGLKDWIPSAEHREIVKSFYDEEPMPNGPDGAASDSEDDDSEDSDSSDTDSDSDSDTDIASSAQIQGHGNSTMNVANGEAGGGEGDDMDIDRDSPSEALFVTPGPGPNKFSPDAMEVDYPAQEADNDGTNLSESLFVSLRSGSSFPPQDRVVIDLTSVPTDDEDESTLSHPSRSGSIESSVKDEEVKDEDDNEDFDSFPTRYMNQLQGLHLDSIESDDEDLEDDPERFVQEETPPPSDELDLDTGSSSQANSLTTPPTSLKRSSDHAGSNEGSSSAKRSKL
ncbi:hypothetical protein F5Y04DRAFT_275906 [Hypomontagnella monticulosa]|nr:hypothetical protein F5Y04DRAFT_275906 [Hypomontagnella monticulosa]